MSTVAGLLAACLVANGCSAPTASAPSAEPTRTPDPSVGVVRSIHNIFGAWHETAPDPGDGGGGQVPPAWPLPSGATRIVSFPSVSGAVTPRATIDDFKGPGGDEQGRPTDIESYGGISGMVHQTNGMFLVGVFLTDDEPADPAPERLDFTDNEDFDLLEPEIGQTFFIGDGVGHRYLAPPAATRLFLGFIDGFLYQGLPGWYGNNSGELEVKVEVSVE